MKILIKTVEGKTINLEVEDSSETIDIKIRGEPTRQLVLGLTPDSGPVRGAVMKFFRGDVEGSDTIKSVKEKIQDKKGFLVADQRLVYHGKQLEDGRTIADCNIQDGSILNIFLRP